jgi:hypothetical protein
VYDFTCASCFSLLHYDQVQHIGRHVHVSWLQYHSGTVVTYLCVRAHVKHKTTNNALANTVSLMYGLWIRYCRIHVRNVLMSTHIIYLTNDDIGKILLIDGFSMYTKSVSSLRAIASKWIVTGNTPEFTTPAVVQSIDFPSLPTLRTKLLQRSHNRSWITNHTDHYLTELWQKHFKNLAKTMPLYEQQRFSVSHHLTSLLLLLWDYSTCE